MASAHSNNWRERSSSPKIFPPLHTAPGFPKTFLQRVGQIKKTAVYGDNERRAAPAGNERRDAAKPSERVRVDDGNARLSPQRERKVERHEIAADGDMLLPLRTRKAEDGQKEKHGSV